MDEDDSSGEDDGFEPVAAALRRVKAELRSAVGHGIHGVRNWVGERWLPVRFLLVGGFSWVLSRTFGWLLNRVVEFSGWVASSLTKIVVSSTLGTQILLVFFGVYLLHSTGQTKLIWDARTNLTNMTTDRRSEVRTDGGAADEIWLPGGAIGGIIAGAAIGWSFGLEGIFVGAGMGWVLGDEFDTWFDEKFMDVDHRSQESGERSE